MNSRIARLGYFTRVAPVLYVAMIAATTAIAASADSKAPSAAQELIARRPGLQARHEADGHMTLFGRSMYESRTPEKAAAGFLAEFGDALGASAPDLRIEWQAALGSGKAVVFAYRQFVDGLPVENAAARLLVFNGPTSAVVYASSHLINVAPGELDPGTTDGAAAVAAVAAMPDYAGLVEWSSPQMVVYAGEADGPRRRPVRAWKFTGRTDVGGGFRAFTFFVNAATGRFMAARNEVYNAELEIFGRVVGRGSPGQLPDVPTNPPAELALIDLTVASASEDTTTDRGGEYILDNESPGAVELTATLAGPWVRVQTMPEGPLELVQSVTPPGPAIFVFNNPPLEPNTAQVNAYVHTVRTHNFMKDRQPGFTRIDELIQANTNLSSTCNAFFTPVGLSINFFAAGGGCVNTAYSSVIAHEYGHYIVHELGLSQGAFGEGYGDSVSIFSYDDPIIGRDFFGPGTSVRDTVGANQQYPCSSEIHTCGQVLAGVWWDIKLAFQSTLGPSAGQDTAAQLFTDWSLITLGGRLRNAAHPATAIEVLTADDDNGDLGDGTPHLDDICGAFAAHNLPCPGSCDLFNSIRASCRRGTITMSVASDWPAGTSVTFVLDGTTSQSDTTNFFGRAVSRFRGVAAGDHEVCIEGCEGSCKAVTCVP